MPTHPRPFAPTGGTVRCACGWLGCVTMIGAVSFTSLPAAHAAREPEPVRILPAECRQALLTGDRDVLLICRKAWWTAHGRQRSPDRERRAKRRRAEPDGTPRAERPSKHDRPSDTDQESPISTKQATPPPTLPAAPEPTPQMAEKAAREPRGLPPFLVFGLLAPAVAAAIAYPLRQRILAIAGGPALAITPSPPPSPTFGYRPAIDPFHTQTLGLTGLGATTAARVLTLAALEECGDTSLVVLPRPDAGALFGLAEDDLLDGTVPQLFIPGTLDAALAYIETELAQRKRKDGHKTTTDRRLLLVADCEKEADRITTLVARHPGELTAVLLGHWPEAQVTVDDEGLVEAPPTLTDALPHRLPALSRTEARDRLRTTIAQTPPPTRTRRKRR